MPSFEPKRGETFEVEGGRHRVVNPDWPSGDEPYCERVDDDEETCVVCGERRGPDQFEDGLRCKFCAEEQDGDG